MNEMGRRALMPLYSLKILNFQSHQNWEESEGIELGLMKFSPNLQKTPIHSVLYFKIGV